MRARTTSVVGECGEVALGVAVPAHPGDRVLPATLHRLQSAGMRIVTGRDHVFTVTILRLNDLVGPIAARLGPGAFGLVWHLLIDTDDLIDIGGRAVQILQAFGVEEEVGGLLTLSVKAKTARMPVDIIHGLLAP